MKEETTKKATKKQIRDMVFKAQNWRPQTDLIPRGFLAVDRQNGSVCIPSSIDFDFHGNPIWVECYSKQIPDKPGIFAGAVPENFELIRSTGLKDSKGADIHEGDVIDITNIEENCGSYRRVVEFGQQDLSDLQQTLLRDDMVVRVVGNAIINPMEMKSGTKVLHY